MAPRTRRLALCALALAALSGCGGSDGDAAGGTRRAARPPVPGPRPGGAPPADAGGAGGGGGAFGAPPRASVQHRRFVVRVNAVCRGAAVPPVAVSSELSRDVRAQRLRAEQTQLRALAAALRPIRAPTVDRARMRAYRKALRAQIVLDGLVADGLEATKANDRGLTMGEFQNDEFNRVDRDRLAHTLGFADCLADHARP
jgi:hypothetical protein